MFEYYRGFKLKNITNQKYIHLLYILFWPVYLALFIVTEKFVVPAHNMYCALDDYIPFCEFFVIPYFLWYGLLVFVSLYGLFYDIATFKRFYKFLCISSAISFILFIVFPSEQTLRPDTFARDNFFVSVMRDRIYVVDTNTNVCPSLHVVFSLGMLFSMWHSKHFSLTKWRIISVILTILVCASTVFLKQHSIIDIFVGIALSFAVLPFTRKT